MTSAFSAYQASSDRFAGAPTFALSHRLFRLGFRISWLLLARWTPPGLRVWRMLVLRAFGARLHPTANVYASARIWYPPDLEMAAYAALGPHVNCYNMARVSLGERALVSQGAALCAGGHDPRDPDFGLTVAPISIGPRAWIAMEAFVGPGVTVGEGAVLGARGVAFKDLEPCTVYAGNPAVAIGRRETAER